MTIISLFSFFKKVFIAMNIWTIEKNLMKHHYLKNFYSQLNVENIADSDYAHAKNGCKDFKTKK